MLKIMHSNPTKDWTYNKKDINIYSQIESENKVYFTIVYYFYLQGTIMILH